MGKGVLIATLATGFAVMMFLFNTQKTSLQTGNQNAEQQHTLVARENAMNARKLLLANWVSASGSASSPPFTTTDQNGGTVEVTGYSLSGDVLDFTVTSEYKGATHEIRSRYRWVGYGLNPVQFGVNKLDIDISPDANIDVSSISLDDKGLEDMNEVIVDQLELAEDLSEFDLGMTQMETSLESELTESGNGTININLIDQATRDNLDSNTGLYFPEQVRQSVDSYVLSHPDRTTTTTSLASLGNSFGGSGQDVLKIEGPLNVTNGFSGQGILIVEGDFTVAPGVAFNWEGLILIEPPSSSLNPQISLEGDVNIEGSLVAIQEGLPNTGHMDFTVFRDMTGGWITTTGQYSPWLRHRHDFSGSFGFQVVFKSNDPLLSAHENQSRFQETLNLLNSNDEVFWEVYNPGNHGRSILTMKLDGGDLTSYPLAAGFDPSIVNPANQFRTAPFKVSDLEHMDISVTRLSALKKMWDSGPDGYPGCPSYDNLGPGCVAYTANRYEAMTMRLYKKNGVNETRIYDAALYWHRRQDEEDEFEDEMNELISDLQSTDYGMDITFGPDVDIVENASIISSLNLFGGLPIGIHHLGTWHRHNQSPQVQTP